MAHRQSSNIRQRTQNSLRAQWKRMNAKVFNAALPPELHELIKNHSREEARLYGGQPNMNKIIVRELLEKYENELSPEDREKCWKFVNSL